MGGLIAQEERELVGIDEGFGESLILDTDGALREPPGLGHLPDQERFGFRGRGMLGEQTLQKRFEIRGIFAGNDDATGSKPVFEGVAAGDDFALGGARAGGTCERSRLDNRLAGKTAGKTAGPTKVLVFEFSGFALGLAALITEFASCHDPISRGRQYAKTLQRHASRGKEWRNFEGRICEWGDSVSRQKCLEGRRRRGTRRKAGGLPHLASQTLLLVYLPVLPKDGFVESENLARSKLRRQVGFRNDGSAKRRVYYSFGLNRPGDSLRYYSFRLCSTADCFALSERLRKKLSANGISSG